MWRMPSRPTSSSDAVGPPSHRRRPTLVEVAAHAGVSRATVSRVVNQATSVDPRLVEVVNASIKALRYVPNPAARALMTRHSDVVALLVTESDARLFGDPFFASIVRGVSQELNRAGLNLVLSVAQEPEELERLETFLAGGLVEGALVISEHRGFDVVTHALNAGLPVVMGGRPFGRRADVCFVDNDNEGGQPWPPGTSAGSVAGAWRRSPGPRT